MKKSFEIIILILSFLGLDATINYIKKKDNNPVENKIEETKAIYISYLEYYDNFYGGSVTINQSKINKMIDNIKNMGFNTIILQVSPFSDAIYPSLIFPYSITLTGKEGKNPGFDYLDYFLTKAHQNKMLLYAWINPYRVSFDSNTNNLSKDNPAVKMINTSNIKVDKKGIYYNPASEIVKELIIKQVKEIIDNYHVDGIHFDDYFYIQDDIDKEEYNNYLKNNNSNRSLDEFRLDNTNDLIKRVYKVIKEKDNKIAFSIAPDGNINNNYIYHYADVKTWLKDSNYIDIIMPQIYYGFEHSYAPFDKVLNEWQGLVKNDVKIIPVLAFYKCGSIDNEALNGKNEWVNNYNLITRQINYLRINNIDSYALFRYDYMFNDKYLNSNSVKEVENLKKINQKYG